MHLTCCSFMATVVPSCRGSRSSGGRTQNAALHVASADAVFGHVRSRRCHRLGGSRPSIEMSAPSALRVSSGNKPASARRYRLIC